MRIAIIAAATMLASCAALAQPKKAAPGVDHYDAITAFTAAIAAARVAEGNCPGVKANKMLLLQFALAAQITDGEQEMVDVEIEKMEANLRSAMEKLGRLEWCSSTWKLFGANGTVAQGLLKR